MGLVADYLQKQLNFNPGLAKSPEKNLGFIVVVPCSNEPDLILSLESLWLCDRPGKPIEVIVVINSSLDAEDTVLAQNAITVEQIQDWRKSHWETNFKVHYIIEKDIPEKYAGPGMARKIGMDEAIARFSVTNTGKGIICSLDADTTCDTNYFIEIEKHLTENPEIEGGSIYFEHPISGEEYPDEVYRAVSLYELNMRYYLQALRSTGFPYAHHTLGSAFFVSSDAYARFGGMNRRKGGEDFYFLQKVIPHVRFIDLLTTRVIPSPRQSDRVPFGTGPWITRFVNKEVETYYTYNYKAFADLKVLFDNMRQLFHLSEKEYSIFFHALPETLKDFITETTFLDKMSEIKNNTSNTEAFVKRFFSWFNGFRIIKYLNYIHQAHYERVDVVKEAENYLTLTESIKNPPSGLSDLLSIYRGVEKEMV